MRTRDFSFNLPEELIAQYPPDERGGSRLMFLDRYSGVRRDLTMAQFPELIRPGSAVLFNDTKVRKSRLFGTTENGGTIEFLLLNQRSEGVWDVVLQRRKRQRPGRRYRLPEGVAATLVDKPEGMGVLRFEPAIDEAYLERNGAIPLPPYIRRTAGAADEERYQTVYSRSKGSVAAPTAGLHFTSELLDKIAARAELHYITLHVGIGTFSPIRAETLDEHRMHSEEYEISPDVSTAVNRARREGRDIVAVGTTTVRTLESAWSEDGLEPGRRSTELFIRPGYRFRCVDRLFTNFHTPESSLLVMVSAFAGRELLLESYAEAVARKYRFFSYGDAMYIQ